MRHAPTWARGRRHPVVLRPQTAADCELGQITVYGASAPLSPLVIRRAPQRR